MLRQVKTNFVNIVLPHEGNDFHPRALQHRHLIAYSYTMLALKVTLVGILFLSFPSVASFSTITQNRIAELANQTRTELGLATLRINPVLTRAAEMKLQDMFLNEYFAHDSPSGVAPWEWFKQVGYTYTYAGENLAMNFTEAEEAHTAWLRSPTHRANIVNANYSEMGVAVGVGELEGREVTLTVQLFGRTFVPTTVAGADTQAKQPVLESIGELAEPVAAPRVEPPIKWAVQRTPVEGPQTEPLVLEQPAVPEAEAAANATTEPVAASEVGKGVTQQVALSKAGPSGLASVIVNFLRHFHWAILILVGTILLIKALFHVKVRERPAGKHGSAIAHGLFVIALGIFLLFLQVHFLEAVSGPVLVN